MSRPWLRLLLRATTSPPRPWDAWWPFRARFDPLRRAGWSVRVAAPRYHILWAGADDACRRARCLVLPGRVSGLAAPEAEALLEDRLRRLGLSPPAPADAAALHAAEEKVRAALAPPWTGRP